ncbi:hypothetical protein ACP3V5_03625 [Vibrio maritimus]
MLKIITAFLLFISLATNANGDTSWVSVFEAERCGKNVEACFEKLWNSKSDSDVVKAIYVYLDSYDILNNEIPIDSFMDKLSQVSKENKRAAFVLEASIYYHGEHVERDLQLAKSILEDSRFFSFDNPEHLTMLGMIYYQILEESGLTNQDAYYKALSYLKRAYSIDNRYKNRALALMLFSSGDKKDRAESGELFRYYAINGTKEDKERYNVYLETITGK